MRQSDAQLEAVAVRVDSEVVNTIEGGDTQIFEIVETCLDAKGISPLAFDVRGSSSVSDTFLIVSGRSDRHVQGIANKIISHFKERSIEPYSVQGMEKGHWVIIDLIDTVVHIMYEPERERYDLESLWIDAKARVIPPSTKQALAS